MRSAGVELEGITRRFGDRIALDDVDLSVAPGEVVEICGPNGAGKTTLLRVIATLLTPHSGRGIVGGADLLRSPEAVRSRIAIALVNERALYWRLDGFANLVFFARLRGMRKRVAQACAGQMIESLGLSDVASRRVGTWSSGQRQRLVVGRAAITDPLVLLLDEPGRGLDGDGVARVSTLVQQAAEHGATVLLAAPEPDGFELVSDRVLRLEAGRIVHPSVVGLSR